MHTNPKLPPARTPVPPHTGIHKPAQPVVVRGLDSRKRGDHFSLRIATWISALALALPLVLTGCGGGGGGNSSSASNGSGLSIKVQGSKLVNGSGTVVQLRGVNYSGFEYAAVEGWSPSDPSGAQAGQPGGPNWAAIKSWKANVVRLPMNEASWLGYTCTDTDGVVRNPDPGGNYKAAIAEQVRQANAVGLYVILDLHWSAPGNACPMLQTQMANADHSIAFWTSVANTFKNNPAVIFCLFNEPFFEMDFTGDPWSYMMFGTNGAFSGYPATSNTGNWKDVKQPWAIASYQAMINAVRATGATNVVVVGSVSYTQDLSGFLANVPVDPAKQMTASWHAYPQFGSVFGTAAYSQPNFPTTIFDNVKAIIAAGYPVLTTETGDQNSPGTVGAPLASTVAKFADETGASLVAWTWDVWTIPNNVLIKDVNGTPTDGYGVFFHNWLVNHAP
jgi:aryl-phospho-beta-D-glucosidase BglC (GH1 family)